MPPPALVTFDLFSALIDSRTGAGAVFAAIAAERGWAAEGAELYARWDARNKAAQRDCSHWVPFAELARNALAETYLELGLDGDAGADTERLLGSVGGWPLWPDVAAGLPAIAAQYPVGVLSNVDDADFARTQAAAFIPADRVLSSQRLNAYKPKPEIYLRARERFGPIVHVASSARDVRGSLEAGLPAIRLRRDGHTLDPRGPAPGHTAADLGAVLELLPAIGPR